jgi:hypothetical protein
MKELRDLITLKQDFFKDHKQRVRKKFVVALKRLIHPFTLLSLIYICTLIYDVNGLRQQPDRSLLVAPLVTILVILSFVCLDVYLQI